MNKQVKILTILLIIAGSITFVSFLVALYDSSFNIFLATAKISLLLIGVDFPIAFCLVRQIRIDKYPIKHENAKIIDLQYVYQAASKYYAAYAIFKTTDNLLWTFDVPKELFNTMYIGQTGILSYRIKDNNGCFVFFAPNINE